MAKATKLIISYLRDTAAALSSANDYQWGHMGSCNCGFLAQQISKIEKRDIHRYAMQRHGDWSEQLNDYCATSGLEMDSLISMMLTTGFDSDDLRHLEKLSDPEILRTLFAEHQYLRHNVKSDVILYLNGWADNLEAEMAVDEIRTKVVLRALQISYAS
ncbi:MAG: hypothetical protein ABI477_12175 [Chryseolinea sp.]